MRSLLILLLLCSLPVLPGCTGDGKTEKTKKKKKGSSSSSSSDDDEAKTGDANPLGADAAEEAPGKEGLQALMDKLFAAMKAKDADTLAEITRNLMPTIEQAKAALAEDCDPAVIEKLEKALSKRPPDDDPRWSKMFRYQPKRTEIQIHPATVEQMAAKGPESREFPGGAIKAAQKGVLRPEKTFYEVEFTEPGQNLGTKYHLFFHDGTRWRMLGKIWRAMPRD